MAEDANSAFEAIKEEIKSTAIGRFSSPFFGAFLLS